MRLFLISVLLIIAWSCSNGQTRAYMGKKVLIRMDLIEGTSAFLTGISAEYLINRRVTIDIGIKSYDHGVNQIYNEGEYLRDPGDLTIDDKAEVHTNAIRFGLRLYHGNLLSLPAPDGWFNYFNFSYGQLDVNKGAYYLLLTSAEGVNSFSDVPYNQMVTYEYQNINFYSLESGIGLQRLINKYITIGGTFGLAYTRLILDNQGYTEKIISGVAKEYGSNLYALSFLNKGQSESIKSNIGFSLNIQVGVLIF